MLKDHSKMVDLIAESCRILGELDITKEALGHVSWRIPGTDTMLIKGKGPGEVGLRFSQPHDVLLVDFQANKIEGKDDLQPPSETFIHIWQYKTRPEVASVIHMHPEHAVLLTICEKPIFPIYGSGSGARFAVEGVPTYPRSITITDDQLGQDLAKVMGNKPVCLMRGHGVTVVGRGVEHATLNTLDLNELCTMTYKAYVLGDPKPILEEDIAEYRRPQEEHRARGSAGGETGMMARWRYFKMLAEEKARTGR